LVILRHQRRLTGIAGCRSLGGGENQAKREGETRANGSEGAVSGHG